MDQLREHALPLARHELGHYVVATVLGFLTGDVEIELTGFQARRGASVICLGHGHKTLDGLEKYLTARIQVLYAGALAEALVQEAGSGGVWKINGDVALRIIRGEGGSGDHAKASELIHVLRGIRHSEIDLTNQDAVQAQLDEIDHELWNASGALVETHAEAIVGLAGNLAGRVNKLKEPAKITDADFATYPVVQNLRQLGRKAREDCTGEG